MSSFRSPLLLPPRPWPCCCAPGLRQEGLSGCILCDGMGLGKTFQVTLRAAGFRRATARTRNIPQPLLPMRAHIYTHSSKVGPSTCAQSIATLWTLLTTGPHAGKPAAAKPLILCPASLVANWGAELTRWWASR